MTLSPLTMPNPTPPPPHPPPPPPPPLPTPPAKKKNSPPPRNPVLLYNTYHHPEPLPGQSFIQYQQRRPYPLLYHTLPYHTAPNPHSERTEKSPPLPFPSLSLPPPFSLLSSPNPHPYSCSCSYTYVLGIRWKSSATRGNMGDWI